MIKLQLQVSVRFNESLRHLVVQVVKVTGDKDVYVPHNFEHVQPLKKNEKTIFCHLHLLYRDGAKQIFYLLV